MPLNIAFTISRVAVMLFILVGTARAQPAPVPRYDHRFKADLLLVVAHPDDDVLAGTYLAKITADESKRVAVVLLTSGDSGGNDAGAERAASLGVIRQVEGRRGLATLGITNVWFLSGRDTAGQDPLQSLANWGHGRVLAEMVRIVRLTRPEIVLTWLPMQVVGENHGDHQAAAIVATEAFDMAGDPTVFPEQVAAPVQIFEALLEGLRPWQAKKLYFMSDAADTRFMEGHGPAYPVTASSKSRGIPYWQFAYEQLQAHVTQYRTELEQLAAADVATRERLLTQAAPGDALIDPLRFVRGKSYVGGAASGDVFEGITDAPVDFVPAPGIRSARKDDFVFALGGPWHYYRQFWEAHDLADLAAIAREEIGPIRPGSAVRVPLLLGNASASPREVTIRAMLPAGWLEQPRPATLLVPAGGWVEIVSVVTTGATQGTAGEIAYEAEAGSGALPTVKVRIVLQPGARPLPQP
jgi:LmbE family N-acetylglucosaminyl deacetylase